MISTMLLALFCLCAAVSFYYAVCALYSKIKLNKNDSVKKISFNRKYLIAVCILFAAVSLFFNFIFAVLSVITALYIKYVSDDKKKKDRIKKINSQITEAIKIFKNSVMTGQSLIQAVNEVSKQTNEPLSGEFKKVCDSVSLGISLDDALSQTSKNITSSQYKLFIDAIRISNITGAKLSDILEKIEKSVAKQTEIYSKVEALTAQGKMSGLIVSIVPFFIILFVYLLEPDIMGILFTTTVGNIIFFIAVLMLLLGSFLMKKLTEIEI